MRWRTTPSGIKGISGPSLAALANDGVELFQEAEPMPQTESNQRSSLNSRRTNPYGLATGFGDLVKSLVVILFWSIVAAVGCGAAYIAIRGVLWAVGVVLRALGAL
jgi:hypothetical protein